MMHAVWNGLRLLNGVGKRGRPKDRSEERSKQLPAYVTINKVITRSTTIEASYVSAVIELVLSHLCW